MSRKRPQGTRAHTDTHTALLSLCLFCRIGESRRVRKPKKSTKSSRKQHHLFNFRYFFAPISAAAGFFPKRKLLPEEWWSGRKWSAVLPKGFILMCVRSRSRSFFFQRPSQSIPLDNVATAFQWLQRKFERSSFHFA